jgi:hypothetical protein
MPTISDYIGDLFIEWRTTDSTLGTTGVTPILTPTTGSLIWNGTADWTINSIAPPSISKYNTLTIRNLSPSNNAVINLMDSNAASSSVLLFRAPGSSFANVGAILTRGDSITLTYDSTLARWIGKPDGSLLPRFVPTSATSGATIYQNSNLMVKTVGSFSANVSVFSRFVLSYPMPVRSVTREVVTAGGLGTISIYADASNSTGYRIGGTLATTGTYAVNGVGVASVPFSTPAYLGTGVYWIQMNHNATTSYRCFNNPVVGADYTVGVGDYATFQLSESINILPQPDRAVSLAPGGSVFPILLFS